MEPVHTPLHHGAYPSDIDPIDPESSASVLRPAPAALIGSTARPGDAALAPGPASALSSTSDRVFVLDKTAFAPSNPKRRASRAAATYPRKRATQACLTCRFRRTKCDNARPSCAACVRLGADCNYQESDPSSFDPASLAILKRLDDLEGLLIQSRSPEPHAPNPETSTPLSAPLSDQGSYMVDVWARGKRPLVSVEAVLQWPPFREYGFPARLYPAPGADDDRLSTGPRGSVDIDLPAAEVVVRNFFDNVHIFNPILDEEDVQDYIKRIRFEGIGWDAVSCLVLLIYAHGSIVTPFVETAGGAGPTIVPADFRQSTSFHQAESYFVAAQKRMGMLLCRSGVIDAQCFFLAGVYLMSTLRPVEAWKMFVQALACCQAFSIDQHKHQDRGEADDGRPEDDGSNPKRRIYWTCFKSELELRLELNPSQKDVWDLTYPAFFPSPPEALKVKDETAWYFYLAEIALMRLKNRILSYLYRSDMPAGLESSTSMEYAILDFEQQIEAWLRSLPNPLQLGVPNASDKGQHQALRFILNGHLLDCQEVMYWQYVVDAVHDGPRRGHYAELFLRKGLKVCVDRIRQNRWGFHHRHHGTWLMLRSCTRSSFVLLAAARCAADLAPYLPADWEDAVLEVVRMLDLWKDECGDVAQMLGVLRTLLGRGRGDD